MHAKRENLMLPSFVFTLNIAAHFHRAALQAGSSAACDEPDYSDSSVGEELLLLVGGGGDLRYTLNLRPGMSLSNSNRLTRSMEVFELELSCPSKQRGVPTVSATVGLEALEILPRGGGGDLRYTLNSRPFTSLSNSNRLTLSMERSVAKQLGDVEAFILLPEDPWGRLLGEWSVVPVMVLGGMKKSLETLPTLTRVGSRTPSKEFHARGPC